tara:strand:+ start:236 stop:469 length:234 start_codon:yes stop_codon:yes gene_type:complete
MNQERVLLPTQQRMTEEFQPTKAQIETIARTIEFIQDELKELKQELNCPDSYIDHLVERITCLYKDNRKDQGGRMNS